MKRLVCLTLLIFASTFLSINKTSAQDDDYTKRVKEYALAMQKLSEQGETRLYICTTDGQGRFDLGFYVKRDGPEDVAVFTKINPGHPYFGKICQYKDRKSRFRFIFTNNRQDNKSRIAVATSFLRILVEQKK